jgi:ribosomal protein S18 acetylase RimI-like enzyme
MAAIQAFSGNATSFDVVDLRRVGAGGLDALLREEILSWRETLHWDFTASAELVQRYLSIHALDGLALLSGNRPAGYIYWVSEGRKALVGDLYVRDEDRSAAAENLLLEGALNRLTAGPHLTSVWVRRVEAQLMRSVLRAEEALPNGPRPAGYRRHFMLAETRTALRLPRRDLPADTKLAPFGPRWIDEAAQLIARVYENHVDSAINDQYRTTSGAQRFLQNVVQYPGCGTFQPRASFVLLDNRERVRALSIASQVAPDVGHVAQICADRELHGRGVGYEMLRRTTVALAENGAREVTLTVTAGNTQARGLYVRTGYRLIHEFDALIWENLS